MCIIMIHDAKFLTVFDWPLQKAESAMKKVEIAERAQREASNVEKDYEEVVQLLEAEVAKLKEDRKTVSVSRSPTSFSWCKWPWPTFMIMDVGDLECVNCLVRRYYVKVIHI